MLKDDIAAADSLNLTYGAYVTKYGTQSHQSQEPSQAAATAVCAVCGCDISHRSHLAKYCETCAFERNRKCSIENSQRYRQSYKTDRQKRGTG